MAEINLCEHDRIGCWQCQKDWEDKEDELRGRIKELEQFKKEVLACHHEGQSILTQYLDEYLNPVEYAGICDYEFLKKLREDL